MPPPLLRAAGEPIPATPPMHGLQTGATLVQTPDRWEAGGARFYPENCGEEGATWDPSCLAWPEDGPPAKSEFDRDCRFYDVANFVIEAPFENDAQHLKSISFQTRARRQLEAVTSKQMEFELWTATLIPSNPSLDEDFTAIGAGAGFSLLGGISLLGQALSNCATGGRGTIHAPTFIVDQWLALYSGLFNVDNNRITTKNRGDVIVSGTGYPGTGEGGDVPPNGSAWVFATGPVQYRLTDIEVYPDSIGEAMNRGQNDVEYRAERQALINFDPCCHFGILIDPEL